MTAEDKTLTTGGRYSTLAELTARMWQPHYPPEHLADLVLPVKHVINFFRGPQYDPESYRDTFIGLALQFWQDATIGRYAGKGQAVGTEEDAVKLGEFIYDVIYKEMSAGQGAMLWSHRDTIVGATALAFQEGRR